MDQGLGLGELLVDHQAAAPNHILTIEEVAEILRCSKAHTSKASVARFLEYQHSPTWRSLTAHLFGRLLHKVLYDYVTLFNVLKRTRSKARYCGGPGGFRPPFHVSGFGVSAGQ